MYPKETCSLATEEAGIAQKYPWQVHGRSISGGVVESSEIELVARCFF